MAHFCGYLRFYKHCGSSARDRVETPALDQSLKKVTSPISLSPLLLFFSHTQSNKINFDTWIEPCTSFLRFCSHTRTHKPKHEFVIDVFFSDFALSLNV